MDLVKLEAIEVEGTHAGRPVRLLVCSICWGQPPDEPLRAFRRAGAAGAMREHVVSVHGPETLASVLS